MASASARKQASGKAIFAVFMGSKIPNLGTKRLYQVDAFGEPTYLDLTKEEKLYLLSYCDEWPTDEPNDYSEEEVLNNDLGLVGGPHESFFFHHRNLESLQKAANNDCDFCYQIFFGLPQTTKVNHDSENSYDRVYLVLQAPDFHSPDTEHLYWGDLDVRFGQECLGNLRLKDLNDFAKFAPSSQNMESGWSITLTLISQWLYTQLISTYKLEGDAPHR
ncbi:hypothetical protein BKA61DRAFT_658493, partial [Leptodontidium sp. MPI-SDFR-AT-0119]